MEAVVTIRLDIAKSVQVHGVDADGAVIVAGGLRARLARVARIGQAGDIGQPDVILPVSAGYSQLSEAASCVRYQASTCSTVLETLHKARRVL